MTQNGVAARPLALVTGASAGIGWAFAHRLADQGYDLIVVGRRAERLAELAAELPGAQVRPVVADLGTDAGIAAVADLCASEPLSLLVNNAGVAHYMPLTQLPADKAAELLHVKVIAPTMLSRAVVPGMVSRGTGTIINVAGMLGFGAAAPPQGRVTYVATLAHLIALSQAMHQELSPQGLQVQVLCPGVVATEFHTRQGFDLSAIPRMSADDVVTASLKGLALGEVICAPGVEDAELLKTVEQAELAAFHGQSPELAQRYRN
ncbi:SDR family NAD(P)-dependent oxidoreductase [Deinococcus sp. HMF7620]|uniref:SDR family NAD(P)-dependent oxidoreductase n=1 Tax=Deinococcus arboris TaxID=2682977 RepID=A0A7C9LQM9_9DEIO|nr:SDR family NAD(P)-dependent oxidoreductase [Deinococcus arboris]MVN88696.1 SDR family NAD(P)-dependent oxidoreductase [Deinococcus arboris]